MLLWGFLSSHAHLPAENLAFRRLPRRLASRCRLPTPAAYSGCERRWWLRGLIMATLDAVSEADEVFSRARANRTTLRWAGTRDIAARAGVQPQPISTFLSSKTFRNAFSKPVSFLQALKWTSARSSSGMFVYGRVMDFSNKSCPWATD